MKNKTFLFAFFLLLIIPKITIAQIECAAVEVDKLRKAKYPAFGNIEKFEKWLAPKIKEFKQSKQYKSGAVQSVPIIFHVLHNGEAVGTGDNLSRQQILAQLAQLNLDFNYTGGDINVSEDLEIRFCAATVDPGGNFLAEPGINRVDKSTLTGIPSNTLLLPSFIDANVKPATQWDPEDYVNVWIMQLLHPNRRSILFGYAQFPDYPSLAGLGDDLSTNTEAQSMVAQTDGIVISPTVVGSEALPPTRPNNSHTLAHEMGHFFGLRHTPGDPDPTGTLTQRCQADDFCDDTPRIAGFNQTCVTSNQCDDTMFGSTTDPNDDFTNYMDSADACRSRFTPDQKDRVQTILNNAPRRQELLSSAGCFTIVLPNIPDLFPCLIDVSLNFPFIGGVFDICNATAFPIDPSFVGVYISPIENPFPLYLFQEVQINNIPPNGAVSGFQFGGTFPPNLPAGDYQLILVADHRNQIQEYDETNNELGSDAFNVLGSSCDHIVAVECGDVNTFNISNNYPNHWEDYNCSQFVETGPERVFSFTSSQRGTVTITKTDLSTGSNGYMYLTSICNPESCLGQGENTIVVNDLDAGEYFIVVELYNGADLNFILQVDCETSIVPCNADFQIVCNEPRIDCFGNWNEQRIDDYECQFIGTEDYFDGASFSDKEFIYELEVAEVSDIMISVRNLDPNSIGGFAAILIEECQFGSCLAYTQNEEAIFYPQLPAGVYSVIVERLDPLADCFQLYVDCFKGGIQQDCPEVLNLYHGPIPSNQYSAKQEINIITDLQTSGSIELNAKNAINLLPSFYTNDPNAVLNTLLDGCQ